MLLVFPLELKAVAKQMAPRASPHGAQPCSAPSTLQPRPEKRTFSPLAFAGLVKLGIHVLATLEDRCITIELRRRLPDERISRFLRSRTDHLRELARRTARWGLVLSFVGTA